MNTSLINTPPKHSNEINEPHHVAVAIFFRLFTSMNAEFDWFLHQELSIVTRPKESLLDPKIGDDMITHFLYLIFKDFSYWKSDLMFHHVRKYYLDLVISLYFIMLCNTGICVSPCCTTLALEIEPILCNYLFSFTILCNYRIKNKSNCTMLCNTLLHFHNRVIILISPCFVILDLDCFDWDMVTSFYRSADFIISYTWRPIGRKFSKCWSLSGETC